MQRWKGILPVIRTSECLSLRTFLECYSGIAELSLISVQHLLVSDWCDKFVRVLSRSKIEKQALIKKGGKLFHISSTRVQKADLVIKLITESKLIIRIKLIKVIKLSVNSRISRSGISLGQIQMFDCRTWKKTFSEQVKR